MRGMMCGRSRLAGQNDGPGPTRRHSACRYLQSIVWACVVPLICLYMIDMKITQSHLTFYRQKKVPIPSWAGGLKYPNQGGSIHELINIQAAQYDRRLESCNLLALIRLASKNFTS